MSKQKLLQSLCFTFARIASGPEHSPPRACTPVRCPARIWPRYYPSGSLSPPVPFKARQPDKKLDQDVCADGQGREKEDSHRARVKEVGYWAIAAVATGQQLRLAPLSRTNIAALSVILFLFEWNQYLWPLLVAQQDRLLTIVVGIQRIVNAAETQPLWNQAMALSILAMLPPVLVIVLMQRLFLKALIDTEN
jgi:hypothetical protein